MTFKYCMNELTRPQLMIWFERTAQREKDNIINQEKQNWAKFANLMSLVASMGSKRKYKPKDFMPQFEAKESRSIDEFQSKEELYGYLKEEGQV